MMRNSEIFSPHRIFFLGDLTKENKMCKACCMSRGEEKCVQGFGTET
jgi:hypothetical protein